MFICNVTKQSDNLQLCSILQVKLSENMSFHKILTLSEEIRKGEAPNYVRIISEEHDWMSS